MIRPFDVNWRDPRSVIAFAQQIDPDQRWGVVVVRGDVGCSITHAGHVKDREILWPRPELNPALHV